MNFFLLPTISLSIILACGEGETTIPDATPTGNATATTPPAAPSRPVVDLAICLDTSGSMDGLIDAARRNIWTVVNDLALAEPAPEIRIAFLTFGNDGHDEADGWVKVHSSLTGDLDLISQELFAQVTNGGTELVARVVDRAANALEWSADPDSLKIIIVAGNEAADQDTEISFRDACRRAIAKGIMVNSIYCGAESDAEASAWREVSMLADGSFATIDQDSTMVEIPTPFDDDLMALNGSFNETYLYFGAGGQSRWMRQTVEDENTIRLGAGAAAGRMACKTTSAYGNAEWDLCDAVQEGAVDLEQLDAEELPEEMQDMTTEQRRAYIAGKQAQRDELTEKIQDLTKNREAFIAKEKARLAVDESRSLGTVLRAAIRKQALAKGVVIPAPVAPPVAETPADDAAPKAAEAGS